MPRCSSRPNSARLLVALLALPWSGVAFAATVDPALPAYVPQSVTPPTAARYLTRDGAIAIVGYNDMQRILEALDMRFSAAHPGFRFALNLKGTATAAPALTHGVTLFAPMGAEFSMLERVPYVKIVGAEPLVVRVAHATPNAAAKSGPLALVVHPSNPLVHVTLEQLGKIFGAGVPRGALETWNQLGLRGGWDGRAIRPCGLAEDTALGEFFQQRVLGGRPFADEFDPFVQSREVVERVADDPMAIGFASATAVTTRVKVLAIAANANDASEPPDAQSITAGRYPLDRFLWIAIRREPGQPVDPIVREYLRLVFSREGQQAIADAEPHYLPLRADEAAAELAKIE